MPYKSSQHQLTPTPHVVLSPASQNQNAPLLADLDEPLARHSHQRLDFCWVPVEVLDRKGVNGNVGDLELEEEAEDALERLEALLVADTHGLALASCVPSVAFGREIG